MRRKIKQTVLGGLFDDPDATLTVGDPGDADLGRPAKPAKEQIKIEDIKLTPPTPEQVADLKAALDAEAEPVPAPQVNREEWLTRAVEMMKPLFKSKSYEVPPVRVSCGWPSVKGLAAKSRRIGECWDKEAAKDGVNQIFISPFLDQATEDATLLATLVHEVVHAVVGLKAKHGKAFKKCATAVGLEGKMKATYAGEELKGIIKCWEVQLGKYPHAQLDALKRPTKKQSTRMIKCECPKCHYTVRTARKWLDEVGAPHCPKHGAMEFEIPAELDTPEESEDTDE